MKAPYTGPWDVVIQHEGGACFTVSVPFAVDVRDAIVRAERPNGAERTRCAIAATIPAIHRDPFTSGGRA
jgi:hypothetical protein